MYIYKNKVVNPEKSDNSQNFGSETKLYIQEE